MAPAKRSTFYKPGMENSCATLLHYHHRFSRCNHSGLYPRKSLLFFVRYILNCICYIKQKYGKTLYTTFWHCKRGGRLTSNRAMDRRKAFCFIFIKRDTGRSETRQSKGCYRNQKIEDH